MFGRTDPNIFGWSYPPGCSGLPEDDCPAPSQLVDELLQSLEDAGVPEAINNTIVEMVEQWERNQLDKQETEAAKRPPPQENGDG